MSAELIQAVCENRQLLTDNIYNFIRSQFDAALTETNRKAWIHIASSKGLKELAHEMETDLNNG